MRRKGLTALLAGFGVWVIAAICPAAEVESVRKVIDQYAALARSSEQQGTITVPGKEGWLFFGPELRFVSSGPFWGPAAAKVSKATKPEFADPLPAIGDFHRQLKKMGVELLMVPVPPKSVVYPDFLSDQLTISREKPPARIDLESQAFYQLLHKEGIQVLDLTPFFLANRFHREGGLFCRQDTHWSGNGAVLAARKIYEVIQGRPWLKAIPKTTYQSAWKSIPIAGDLWRAMGEKGLPQETVSVRQVGTGSAGALKSIAPDQKSPIILVGDSHNLVFHAGDDMHTRDAGLPDQLALELGFPVDLAGVRGSGATPARVNLLRRAQRDPGYWKKKKLVIWCFASREFTQSDGWKKVPLIP
jgi:alginate O-acetyltransferase complex protein AlgJ